MSAPRKKRAPKREMVVASEKLGPPIEESFTDGLHTEKVEQGPGPVFAMREVKPLALPPYPPGFAGARVKRHPVVARAHVELAVGDVPATVEHAVVRVLVRRGEDGAKAKRDLEAAGAAHVVVAPVPSDAPATAPQREVMADDPVTALREYARRDPSPKDVDVAALAGLVFDLGGMK